MTRITFPPNYTGTSGPNLVMGEETSTDPTVPGIGIVVLPTGVINTLAGDDTVKGAGTGADGGDGGDGGDGIGISTAGRIWLGACRT
jgi:hypothetical protein